MRYSEISMKLLYRQATIQEHATEYQNVERYCLSVVRMVRGEGLGVLEERMKTMDPDENEIYKFLGIEQADGIKTKKVFDRGKSKVSERLKLLTNTILNDVNLVRAINTKVIPVAAYSMKVCKFNGGELKELDQVIKRELR